MSDEHRWPYHPYFVNDRGRFIFDFDLEGSDEEETEPSRVLPAEVRTPSKLQRDTAEVQKDEAKK